MPDTEVKNTAEELTYEYQPQDADGRPLGGKQVIKYHTQQELIDKLAQQNNELIRLNRKMKQDQALGINTPTVIDAIPEDAERDLQGSYTFTPKQLSVTERMQLAQDMGDPDRIEQFAEKFSEVIFGEKPDKVRQAIQRTLHDSTSMRAYQESVAFREAHPEFHPSGENVKVLISLMQREGLAPTKTNFEIVFARAQKAGLLIDAPEVAEGTQEEAHPGDEPDSRITVRPSQQTRPVVTSTGLKGRGAAPGGTGTVRTKTWSKAEIANMTAQEYKEKVLTPQLRQARK